MTGKNYEKSLKILGILMVEIRATENLRTAHALADIAHNIPSKIRNDVDETDIINELREKAKKWELEKYTEGLVSRT